MGLGNPSSVFLPQQEKATNRDGARGLGNPSSLFLSTARKGVRKNGMGEFCFLNLMSSFTLGHHGHVTIR